MVDLLLEAKASTKMATNETQSTCLHIAAKNNAVSQVSSIPPLTCTGWFRLNAKNCVPGNSSRRFFELDHEILHTYSGRQYLKLEEGGF